MVNEAWKGFASCTEGALHGTQCRFIRRQACFIIPPFQMKHCFTIVQQYEASSASLPIWSVAIGTFFDNLRQSNRLAFRFKFSVWRIWRTGERHKAAEILRFALFGDTAFMLKIGWFFAFQVEKNKSPTIFLWIKTLRSLCPRLFYLNTFVLNQP